MKGSPSKVVTIIIIVLFALLLCGSGCSNYNKLVTSSETVDQAWSQVEVQYQRRFDLIPNLVETVKGYAQHESSTFEKVTQARAGLTQAYNDAKALEGSNLSAEESFEKYTAAQTDLGRAFNIYVNAVTEAYPDLKADTQFRDLQVQLEGCENRIATERNKYTEAVKEYNLLVKRFPGNLWASIFGYQAKPQFKADAQAATAPKVSF